MQTVIPNKVLKLPMERILLKVFWSCPLPLMEKGYSCIKNTTLIWNTFEPTHVLELISITPLNWFSLF